MIYGYDYGGDQRNWSRKTNKTVDSSTQPSKLESNNE